MPGPLFVLGNLPKSSERSDWSCWIMAQEGSLNYVRLMSTALSEAGDTMISDPRKRLGGGTLEAPLFLG